MTPKKDKFFTWGLAIVLAIGLVITYILLFFKLSH
jgi:hypothetical protein